jgi:HAD superfamily hydrolase (TIGR01509 family)
MSLSAVLFDLDGVLLDSEPIWNEAKEALVREAGGRWREDAPRAMMGMSSPEWSSYLRDVLDVKLSVEEINRDVVERIERLYRENMPLVPGATEAVSGLSRRWPLGLASSSNREIIDLFVSQTAIGKLFSVTVSSEEVERGKPAPDVYLETARRMAVVPRDCVAVEDSSNGMRSANAAGMKVVAVPNPHYPPDQDALSLASVSVDTVAQVTVDLIENVG